ncbi:hypothetical protein KKC1_18960 [Calderihabitans maritimus]|uniref:Uncharacterized protein n=1 Tax=Calderihabitans maritimus TaxID=1246530 RepID=A0A1Z5HT81_9FIRM|nr:hypothetical protein KKC1_18960 [Calderihabitans maritimus]
MGPLGLLCAYSTWGLDLRGFGYNCIFLPLPDPAVDFGFLPLTAFLRYRHVPVLKLPDVAPDGS